MSAPSGLHAVLDDLADYLRHEIDEGRLRTEMDPAISNALSGAAPAQAPMKTPIKTPAIKPSVASTEAPTPPVAPRPQPPVAAGDPRLKSISDRIASCRQCGLCQGRTNTVPGQGHPQPEIAFIGEGPGAEEDAQGLPFVGRSGQLLTRMIIAMGLTREEVWIGNIVKCRPPDNRVPLPEEMQACLPYLKEQLAILKPKAIVCLGATAVKGLLKAETGITKLRGQWQRFEGIDVMPTFHPAYLLRNPPAKKEAWEDLQAVLKHLGKPIPAIKSPGDA